MKTKTEQLAATIAAAEQRLADVQATHSALTEKANIAATRINEARNRQAEITRTRLEGEATAQDAAEFAALVGDIAMLSQMHAEDAQAVSASIQQVSLAQANLERHQQAWERHLTESKFAALLTRAREIENTLADVVTELAGVGQQLGKRRVFDSWHILPGSKLDGIVRNGQLPRG